MATGEFSAHRKLSSLGEVKPGWDIAHAILMLFDTADYHHVAQDRIDLASITIEIDAGHVIVKAKLKDEPNATSNPILPGHRVPRGWKTDPPN